MKGLVFLFFNFGGGEIFLILLFVLLFFGAKQLPDIARTLGKGIREVRNATDEIKREITESARDVNVSKHVEQEARKVAEELNGSVPRKPASTYTTTPPSPAPTTSEQPESEPPGTDPNDATSTPS